MQKHLLLLFVVLLIGANTMSQDLRIQYDNITGVTRYENVQPNGNSVKIDKPFAKRNKKIIVQILNVNPFSYQVTHQVTQNAIAKQFDSTQQLIPYFNNSLQQYEAFLKTNTTVSSTRSPAQRSIVANQIIQARDSLIAIDNELANYMDGYLAIKYTVISGSIPKDSIVKRIDSIVHTMFNIGMTDPVNTNAIIRSVAQRFTYWYSNVKSSYATIKSYIDTTSDLVLASRVQIAVGQADTLMKFYNNGSFMAKLAGISELFQTVSNARFSYQFEEIADMDIADITISIAEKQARIDADTVRNIQNSSLTVKKYRVIIKGENVIKTSVGLSYATLFGQAVQYGVRNLKVAQFDDDRFVPNLTTYINFYPFKGQYSNLGGMLGFGYPLSGKEKNLNILTGISYSFGDKNTVALSGGLLLGQTNKLQPGWEVGDSVPDATTTVPVDKTWKPGVFLGISVSFANR